jgi:hypothetical protein
MLEHVVDNELFGGLGWLSARQEAAVLQLTQNMYQKVLSKKDSLLTVQKREHFLLMSDDRMAKPK